MTTPHLEGIFEQMALLLFSFICFVVGPSLLLMLGGFPQYQAETLATR